MAPARIVANLRDLLRALTFCGVWTVGRLAVLPTPGIESRSIATAVGISGFVLGFAFKDILSHVFAGLMLPLTSLAVLIYFIHSVSQSIQAENLLAYVGEGFQNALPRLFPGRIGRSEG
ncbi:MAG TPA: DUF2254 family protein [Abditibacteriaceae bacterium]|nr:DUF2254 family protein [Abditibacteriaceae bacterium]